MCVLSDIDGLHWEDGQKGSFSKYEIQKDWMEYFLEE